MLAEVGDYRDVYKMDLALRHRVGCMGAYTKDLGTAQSGRPVVLRRFLSGAGHCRTIVVLLVA